MRAAESPVPNALRVAAVWGTTVVALRTLRRGESFALGDDVANELPIPDGIEMSPTPLKGRPGGWDLDAQGSVGGLLTLRGRAEDPAALARAGVAVPVVPGDYGLIQYGPFAIFFQFVAQPASMRTWRGPELLTTLAIFCSAMLHIGVLALVRTLMTPPPLAKPLELTSPEEFAARFGLKRPVMETPPEPAALAGDGAKESPSQDKKPQDAGKKIQGNEGKMGVAGAADRAQLPGEVKPTTHYGGLSDVLEGETGKEIQNTLKSINSVSAALAGLNASTVVLGGGPGAGLKGAATGGGGTGAGVGFAAGTLDTGFGSGIGNGGAGGAGRGGGGAGGGGAGGGGPGRGAGGGPAESKVAVGAGQAASKGGLSQAQVQRVVMAHLGAVRACYETEAQRNPSLRGGVTVAWTIDANGSVSGASLASSTLGNPRVEGCVVRQVKGWRFPSADGPTTVSGFPFKFSVGG